MCPVPLIESGSMLTFLIPNRRGPSLVLSNVTVTEQGLLLAEYGRSRTCKVCTRPTLSRCPSVSPVSAVKDLGQWKN